MPVQLFAVFISREREGSKGCTLYVIIFKSVVNMTIKEATVSALVKNDFPSVSYPYDQVCRSLYLYVYMMKKYKNNHSSIVLFVKGNDCRMTLF